MKNIATYGNKNFPIVLREHFDSNIHIEEKVIPMEYPEITQAELHKHLKNIKKNKATGPDDVKGELYRALGKGEMCVGKLQTALQNIIDKDLKIKSWEKSYTRLRPKVKKPTAKQMRPIALTDVSYKLFMTILGKKIDSHILENNKKCGNTGWFYNCTMIEDNLFTLQYCIEGCYKLKRPLIVTYLDYSKASDSIRRGKIIEALIHYKIHYKIIVAIANIYRNDYTEVQFGEIRREIEITCGIRQGCTGSTILFKIVTHMIMTELDKRGTRYNDEHIKIK